MLSVHKLVRAALGRSNAFAPLPDFTEQTQATVNAVIGEVLGVSATPVHDLRDLIHDSTVLLRLHVELERVFGVLLPQTALTLRPLTIQAIAELLALARDPATPANAPRSSFLGKWEREFGFLGAVDPKSLLFQHALRLLPDFALPALHAQLLRMAGCRIGRRTAVMGPVRMIGAGQASARLTIGEECLIAPNVTFGLDAEIVIGEHVSIGPSATLHTATHDIGPSFQRMMPGVVAKPISVGDGAWIGMKALILSGVTLGAGCVVSAGAVVSADVPPNTQVGGNPATVRASLPSGAR